MSLPEFSKGKLYLLTGDTGKAIVQELQTNRPCCVAAGHLSIASQDPATIAAVPGDGGGSTFDPAPELPEFKPGKLYLPSKETVANMFKIAERNLTHIVTGGGLSVSYSDDGVTVSSA